MPDDTHINLQQTVAVLRQELETRTIERDDALARQSATSEILGVVARSPADIQPVFDAIVAHAAKLCEAEFSAVARFGDGCCIWLRSTTCRLTRWRHFTDCSPGPPRRAS